MISCKIVWWRKFWNGLQPSNNSNKIFLRHRVFAVIIVWYGSYQFSSCHDQLVYGTSCFRCSRSHPESSPLFDVVSPECRLLYADYDLADLGLVQWLGWSIRNWDVRWSKPSAPIITYPLSGTEYQWTILGGWNRRHLAPCATVWLLNSLIHNEIKMASCCTGIHCEPTVHVIQNINSYIWNTIKNEWKARFWRTWDGVFHVQNIQAFLSW